MGSDLIAEPSRSRPWTPSRQRPWAPKCSRSRTPSRSRPSAWKAWWSCQALARGRPTTTECLARRPHGRSTARTECPQLVPGQPVLGPTRRPLLPARTATAIRTRHLPPARRTVRRPLEDGAAPAAEASARRRARLARNTVEGHPWEFKDGRRRQDSRVRVTTASYSNPVCDNAVT